LGCLVWVAERLDSFRQIAKHFTVYQDARPGCKHHRQRAQEGTMTRQQRLVWLALGGLWLLAAPAWAQHPEPAASQVEMWHGLRQVTPVRTPDGALQPPGPGQEQPQVVEQLPAEPAVRQASTVESVGLPVLGRLDTSSAPPQPLPWSDLPGPAPAPPPVAAVPAPRQEQPQAAPGRLTLGLSPGMAAAFFLAAAFFSVPAWLLLLRKQATAPATIMRVELVGGGLQLVAGPAPSGVSPPPATAPAATEPEPADDEAVLAEFLAHSLTGRRTFAQEEADREEDMRQKEQAMFEHVLEQNVLLREQLSDLEDESPESERCDD